MPVIGADPPCMNTWGRTVSPVIGGSATSWQPPGGDLRPLRIKPPTERAGRPAILPNPMLPNPAMQPLRHSLLPILIALLCAPFAGHGQTLGAGNQFSVFLCAPAGLSAAGSDYYGQLGNYASGDQNVAVPVDLTDEVTMVSVQQQQAIVLGADGTVWTWGFRLARAKCLTAFPTMYPD